MQKTYGDGEGSGSGSDSDSGPALASWSDPITVVIAVAEMNWLAARDAAVAAWWAAGDTVIIEGTTEAVGSRGIFRIFGLAAFLTQIGGQPAPPQIPVISSVGSYERPLGYTGQIAYDVIASANNYGFMSFIARNTYDPGISISVNNGGCTTFEQEITATVTVSNLPDQSWLGNVTFYCGEMVRTVDVNRNTSTAECTFKGSDLNGPLGNYTMTAVFNGVQTPDLDYYKPNSTTTTVSIV